MGKSSICEQITATRALHPSALFPAAHPASIQSDQHWLLRVLPRWLLLGWTSAGLLRLLLLLCGSLLAGTIGEQTDLLGTDLRSAELIEQMSRHSIRPGTSCQYCGFL
jgi:hypothetical protein